MRMLFGHTHRTTQLSWQTQKATLSNMVHWEMFLLLQVWRQSCQNTEHVLQAGLLTDDGGKVAQRLQKH